MLKNNFLRRSFSLVVLIVLVSMFFAEMTDAGVGIYYDKTYVEVPVGGVGCISYNVYNPFETDVDVEMMVSEEIKEHLVSITPNTLFLSANTELDSLVPIEFCFKVNDDLYKRDKECLGDDIKYQGNIFARQVPNVAGGGSSARVGVTAPVTISAKCIPGESPQFNLPFPLIAVILIVLIIALLFLKAKEENQGKMSRKISKR